MLSIPHPVIRRCSRSKWTFPQAGKESREGGDEKIRKLRDTRLVKLQASQKTIAKTFWFYFPSATIRRRKLFSVLEPQASFQLPLSNLNCQKRVPTNSSMQKIIFFILHVMKTKLWAVVFQLFITWNKLWKEQVGIGKTFIQEEKSMWGKGMSLSSVSTIRTIKPCTQKLFFIQYHLTDIS